MERFIGSSTSQRLRRHRSGQTTDGRLRVKTNSRRYPGEFLGFLNNISTLTKENEMNKKRFVNRVTFSDDPTTIPPYVRSLGRIFLVLFNVLIIPSFLFLLFSTFPVFRRECKEINNRL